MKKYTYFWIFLVFCIIFAFFMIINLKCTKCYFAERDAQVENKSSKHSHTMIIINENIQSFAVAIIKA